MSELTHSSVKSVWQWAHLLQISHFQVWTACSRSGSRNVRHLSIMEMWAQKALRKIEFRLRVVGTILVWADVGAKSIEKDRLDSVMLRMPLSRGEERQWRLRHSLSCLLHPSMNRKTDVVNTGTVACGYPCSVLRRTARGQLRSATSGTQEFGRDRMRNFDRCMLDTCKPSH